MSRSKNPESPMSSSSTEAPSFASLGVPGQLVRVLAEGGIETAFPIQAATLPDSLAGYDVLGRGRTGSGKTVAFALPMVARVAASGHRTEAGRPRGIILVPTRELAIQVNETLEPLAKAMRLRTKVIVGGVRQTPQVNALRSGVDIVVATPGRLEDLIRQGHARLDDVKVTVLDEADHMADLGFLPIVKQLLDMTPKKSQRMLFSATLDSGVDVLVKRYLSSPITHEVDSAESPVPAMEHHVVNVSKADKYAVVHDLVSGEGRTVAFTRTKHSAKKLAEQLTAAGIPHWICTAIFHRMHANVTSRRSPMATCACLWRQTSRPAASTWMTSLLFFTWIRPWSTSPTFTARAVRHAQAPRASS